MRLSPVILISVAVLPGTLANADPERGRDLFRLHCIGCHAIECNRSGPKLGGVLGRPAGTVPDFHGYSAAMKGSGIVWTEETLNGFLASPGSYVPHNAMAGFGALDAAADRKDLIEFLASPDSSLDLCF
jgi:cytochrome c